MSGEKTPPDQALEALAWHLNFFPGEKLSINETGKATGIAWATARKYARLLSMLSKLAPETQIDRSGIHVQKRASAVEDLLENPMQASALYIFLHARLRGDASQAILWADHPQLERILEKGLKHLFVLGLAEQDERELRLTPAGIALASDTYATFVERVPETLAAGDARSGPSVYSDDAPTTPRKLVARKSRASEWNPEAVSGLVYASGTAYSSDDYRAQAR